MSDAEALGTYTRGDGKTRQVSTAAQAVNARQRGFRPATKQAAVKPTPPAEKPDSPAAKSDK